MAGHKNFQVIRNKATRGINIFNKNKNFNKHSDNLTKSERLMNGIGIWASFYRANPHRFVKDYLGINLKLFQMILIFMMNHNHYFMYLASRGQGKTFLTSVFCLVRTILYPETKVVIASGNKSQAREVIEKIDEMRNESPNLQREISDIRTSTNDARVEFRNGSWIKIVASNDGARSKRANLLIVDEFRMVDFQVISKVLRKFLTAPRQPKFMNKPEYKDYPQERNKEIYLSSAWFKMHWSWERLKSYYKSMRDGKSYFVCGLPYQLAIKENLLMREQVEDEMSEADFDEIGWLMEMECLFFGESEKAYFNYQDIENQRRLVKCLYPKNEYDYIKDKKFKYEQKSDGEVRLVSCDIAGMEGKENDASVYTIIRLIPTKTGYNRNIVYMETVEGGHTGDQANRIRQMFNDFDCDYVVLDTQNMGLGVFDSLVQPAFDSDRNIEYPAWTCINDDKMAARCTYDNADPRIFSVKGNETFNSECAVLLKDGVRRGKVRLLSKESDGKDYLRKIKGFDELTPEAKAHFEHPYKQTTALINEMINLEGERTNSGLVKLKEPRSKRKDRYSSVSYGNYIASQLERDLLRGVSEEDPDDDIIYF